MKNFFYLFLIATLLFSCSDDDEIILKKLTVNFTYDQSDMTSSENISIKLVKKSNSREFEIKKDVEGKYTVKLEEGIYDLTATDEIVNEDGKSVYSGAKQSILIQKEDVTISVEMKKISSAGFVIKEMYYTGAKSEDGSQKTTTDGFVEIYNNSDMDLYADGIGIGLVAPISTTKQSPWLSETGELKEAGIPLIFQTWAIPGTGKDYLVKAGESLVIAIDAINHHQEVDPSPVDLSGANFETYFEPSGKDTDVPGVKNLELLYSTSQGIHDWTFSINGSSVIIFKLPEDRKAFVDSDDSYATTPGSSSTTKYMLIKPEWVLDGVDGVKSETAKYKRLPNSIDVGYTFCPNGSYSATSIRRKVESIEEDGRVIYKDTNNTSEDFISCNPMPGTNPTKVDE